MVMCEFISQSYTYVSWSRPLTLSFRNLRRATLDRIEAYTDKGNIISSKGERSFLRNILISEFVSRSYNLLLRTSLLTVFSWNLQSDIWEPFGTHVEKGNILREKLKRILLRNCIVICEGNSKSYKFHFSDEFAITVSLKSAMGYSFA